VYLPRLRLTIIAPIVLRANRADPARSICRLNLDEFRFDVLQSQGRGQDIFNLPRFNLSRFCCARNDDPVEEDRGKSGNRLRSGDPRGISDTFDELASALAFVRKAEGRKQTEALVVN